MTSGNGQNKPAQATQNPGSLIVYQQLPPDCIAFAVTDEYSLPYLRPGEWAVVDTSDTTPRHGDVYVIQWDGGRQNVCQASISALFPKDEEPRWCVHSMRTAGPKEFQAFLDETEAMRKAGVIPVWRGGWSDGWMDTDHLASKLVGAIVGIYQPDFEGPLRIAGASS